MTLVAYDYKKPEVNSQLLANSPTLRRLIEEVTRQHTSPHCYDRNHNRHNR